MAATFKKPDTDWDDRYYVTTYILARSEMMDDDIAKSLCVRPAKFKKWLEENPALQDAKERGRRAVKEKGRALDCFNSYIFDGLSPEVQELWKEINAPVDKDLTSRQRAMAAMSELPDRAMQRLYLQALVACRFITGNARRMINLPGKKIDEWTKHDPEFAELLVQFEGAKSDYFESQFMEVVESGNAQAAIWAVRTHVPGYEPIKKLDVKGSQQIDINIHQDDIPIDKLLPFLKMETLEDIGNAEKLYIESINGKPKPMLPPPQENQPVINDNIVDAEFTETESYEQKE